GPGPPGRLSSRGARRRIGESAVPGAMAWVVGFGQASRTVMLHHVSHAHFVTHLHEPRAARCAAPGGAAARPRAGTQRATHRPRGERTPWKRFLASARFRDTEVRAPGAPSGDGASFRFWPPLWCWGSGSRRPRTIWSVTLAGPTPSR